MECDHIRKAGEAAPRTPDGCEECLGTGQRWVQLRLCRSCGHVGCCDSSAGKHATRHYRETGHPVMRAYRAGSEWSWCYVDEVMSQLEAGEGAHI